jgi:hypothetical protein
VTQSPNPFDPAPGAASATLASRLETLASAPQPPSGVDVDRAIAEGRAGRRRRTAGVLSSCAASLAAVSVVAAVAVNHTGTADRTVAGESPVATATASYYPGQNAIVLLGNSVDPLVPGARFGWLPGTDPDLLQSVVVGEGAVWMHAAAGGGDAEDFRMATFTGAQTADGAIGVLRSGWPYLITGQTTIDSQDAFWLELNGKSAADTAAAPVTTLALVWLQPSGRWAILTDTGSGLTAATMRQHMLHVAQSATPDFTPIALPLHLGRVPAGDGLSDLQYVPDSAAGRTDWSLDFTLWGPSYSLVYDVGPAGTVDPVTLGPSRCKTTAGTQLCITMEAGAYSKTAAANGVLDTALADATPTGGQPSTWTTDVFGR